MAANLEEAPPVPPGVEVWCCNNPKRAYNKYRPHAVTEATRWFNLHSKAHMLYESAIACGMVAKPYPRGYEWYKTANIPIELQDVQADIPTSVAFPRDELLRFFGHRYFTFSGAWLIAYAIWLGFGRIELYGFQLSVRKPLYARERACFFYWVEEARRRGIEIHYPAVVGTGPAGDPVAYAGPLYGYETT